MSTSPARLSRRSLLRGAASVTVLAAFAAVSSCADGTTRVPDAASSDDSSPLLRLARSVPDQRPAAGTAPPGAAGPDGTVDDGAVVRAIDAQRGAVAADFAVGATVAASGWLLSTTEADALAGYARACPAASC